MAGVIAIVPDEWLDIVRRESRRTCALTRVESARPSWWGAGDDWFLRGAESGEVSCRAEFLEHEMMTVREGFERYGYGSGALTLAHLCSRLGAGEGDLVGWVQLSELEDIDPPWGADALADIGDDDAGDVIRLSAAESRRLRAGPA
jgi:hypothetical protein